MIIAKINVTKIDKARLFKGEKGTCLDICLIETPNGQYDQDYMVTQSVTKEEREQGIKGPILGNARIIGTKAPAPAPSAYTRAPASAPVAAPKPPVQQNLDDDIGF